jgi:hypothetical protein
MKTNSDLGGKVISWLENLRSWFSKTTTEVLRAAVNNVLIVMMITNIRNK